MKWKIPKNSKKYPCIAVAFALACEIPLEDFIQRVGQRGGLIMGTYHHQQCMDVAWDLGYASMSIERRSLLIPGLDYQGDPAEVRYPEGGQKRFTDYLKNQVGILGGTYLTAKKQIGHAVAWNGKKIYDPRGYSYAYPMAATAPCHFYINTFVALIKRN
jgi:hypothetical protein